MLIQMAGFDVAAPPQPAQPMPKVNALALTTGDDDGTGDAVWSSVPGVKSYEVQVSADPPTANSWQHYSTVTRSREAIKTQPSGQKRWMRVRAVNTLGPGPWSDPACAMMP